MVRTIAAMLLLLMPGMLRAQQAAEEKTPSFEPVQIRKPVEAVYPVASVGRGVVILTVSITPAGDISSVDVLHGIASLTEEAEKAVRKWDFQPAKLDGRPVESSIIVAFAFCDEFLSPNLERPRAENEGPGFQPLQVLTAYAPVYPMTSVAGRGALSISVVLQVTVDDTGAVSHIDVVRNVPTLTEPAQEAVRKWKFEPARLNGEPVTSALAASFTFRPPYVASSH